MTTTMKVTERDFVKYMHFLVNKPNEFIKWEDINTLIKDEMGFKKQMAILSHLGDLQLLENGGDGYALNGAGLAYYKDLKKSVEQADEEERLTSQKLRYDTRISKWTWRLFWPAFILALIGGGKAIYDILMTFSGKT